MSPVRSAWRLRSRWRRLAPLGVVVSAPVRPVAHLRAPADTWCGWRRWRGATIAGASLLRLEAPLTHANHTALAPLVWCNPHWCTLSADLPTTRLPAARRRRQLLEVALRVFAERGFHPTSMNDIAEAAGVTKPVLYQHFGSKRELYLELLEDVGQQLRDSIEKATSEATTPHEQVGSGFRAYFYFVANHRDAFQVLFGGGTRRDEEFADAVRAMEISIAEIIAALIEIPGLDTNRRRLLAHGVIGAAEGASRHWLIDGAPGDPDTLADQLAGLVWAGLRGIPGDTTPPDP